MRTTSSAKEVASAGSTMALPPYFTTIDARRGSAGCTAAPRRGRRPAPRRPRRGGHHEVPMFSSMYAWVRSLVRMRARAVAEAEVGGDLEVRPGHVGGQRRRVDRRGHAALGHDEVAVAHARACRARRRCRRCRARWRSGPSRGPCRTTSTSPAGSRRPCGRRPGPRRRRAAPVTWTSTTLVWPSASPTICVARSRHDLGDGGRERAADRRAVRPRRRRGGSRCRWSTCSRRSTWR